MTARIKLKVAPKGASSGKKKPSKKKPVGKKHPNLERQFQLMWDIIGRMAGHRGGIFPERLREGTGTVETCRHSLW